MTRLKTVPPEELTGDQKAYHEEITAFTERFAGDTFVTRRADGALIGPFGALLHTPNVGRQFFALTAALGHLPGLSLQSREVAILVVGTKYRAAYELYAHTNVSLKKTELLQETVDEIIAGKKPENLNQQDEAAYDVAQELATQPGPLSKATWERAVEVLGENGAIALVNFVGFYAYTSILLNGFDIKAPS